MSESTQNKRGLSDDMVDGITALVLIILAVSATVYWLTTLPTS
ncbi:MAG: hypothetical protein ABSF18_06385 [Gammaproteobacteria bacterium]|jgi:hypothetical protein